MESNKPAYFHQIVIGDYLAHRVKIPPLFMKHLSNDLCKEETTNATIKSDVGNWPVKLRKTSTYTYIEEGWQKIMEDNSLGDMEFLVFRYDGNMCFNLQIFEKTGCERIYPPTIVVSGILKEECVYEEINVAQADYTVNFENPHFRKRLTESNVMKYFTLRLPKDFSTKMSSSERVTVEVENTKGEAWEVNATMNTGTYRLSTGWRAFVLANKLNVGDECIFELIGKNKIRVHKIIA